MNKNMRVFYISLVLLISTSPLSGMRILKQEKKKNPAYLLIKKQKLNDPRLPQQIKRDGGETIIIFGTGIFGGVFGGPAITGTAILFGVTNMAIEIATGESLLDYLKKFRGPSAKELKEQKAFKSLCNQKKLYDNLDVDERDEVEDFPKNYDGTPSYNVEPDKNYMHGYKLTPNWSIEPCDIVPPQYNLPTRCFPRPDNTELPQSRCFDEETEKTQSKDHSSGEKEIELPPTECFPKIEEDIPQGCSSDMKKHIKLNDLLRAPGIPTENDRFFPPKKWDRKTRKHPKTGQVGFPDRKGNIWVPTGTKGSRSHGKPHWDVIDKDGNHTNVLPGGKVRETGEIFNPCETLVGEKIKVPQDTTVEVSDGTSFPDESFNTENIFKGFQGLEEYNHVQEKLSKLYGVDFKNTNPLLSFLIGQQRFIIPKSTAPDITENNITSVQEENFKSDNFSANENVIAYSVPIENLKNTNIDITNTEIKTEPTIISPIESSNKEVLSQHTIVANNNKSFATELKEALYVSKDEVKDAFFGAASDVITKKICDKLDPSDKDTKLNNERIHSENIAKFNFHLKRIEELQNTINTTKSAEVISKSQEEISNIAKEAKELQDAINEKKRADSRAEGIKVITYGLVAGFVEGFVVNAVKRYFGWPF